MPAAYAVDCFNNSRRESFPLGEFPVFLVLAMRALLGFVPGTCGMQRYQSVRTLTKGGVDVK
jgi:hypothetical protein